MTEREYDAVFWDVGGVIMDVESIGRGQRAFVEALVEEYGDEYDLGTPAEAIETWRDALREHFAGREGTEYRTAREGRRKAARVLFGGEPPGDWRDVQQRVSRVHVETNPGAVETIRALDDAGVYQAILSDADAGFDEFLDRLGIADCIDDVTTSEEVGHVKPDQRMFRTAIEKAEIDPSRGIMIGDKYRNDMEGGAEAGLTTVAYGAEDGPAVDHRIDDLRELLDVVGVDERA